MDNEELLQHRITYILCENNGYIERVEEFGELLDVDIHKASKILSEVLNYNILIQRHVLSHLVHIDLTLFLKDISTNMEAIVKEIKKRLDWIGSVKK